MPVRLNEPKERKSYIMFCNKCGREIVESSMFCTWCGGKVEAVYSTVPTPSESPRSNLNSYTAQPERRAAVLSGASAEASSAVSAQPEVHVMAAASAEGIPKFQENPAGAAETAETLNPEHSVGEISSENVSAPVNEADGVSEQNEGFSGKTGADMRGASTDMPNSPDMTSPSVSEVILEKSDTPGKPEKTKKYYTGAQLAICLVTTGIMAAAAGIFAGLYFSVI